MMLKREDVEEGETQSVQTAPTRGGGPVSPLRRHYSTRNSTTQPPMDEHKRTNLLWTDNSYQCACVREKAVRVCVCVLVHIVSIEYV